jgi:hypothetical protein
MRKQSTAAIICAALASFLSVITAPANAANVDSKWEINSTEFSSDTAGFASPFSVLPGTKIALSITCLAPTFYLTIYRMGYYEDSGAQLELQTAPQPCSRQTDKLVDQSTGLIAQDWKVTQILDTKKLKPGMYLARINSSDGHKAFIPFVVRDASTKGRVVITVPFQTSLAYNKYTGASSYKGNGDYEKRARVLSFANPFSQGFGSGIYLRYAQPLVKIVDQLKLNPAYVADTDIALDPTILKGAKVLIAAGHDEYWTLEERNSVMKERAAGMNLLFFGANNGYWRIRLAKSPDLGDLRMEIYKSQEEDPNKSSPSIKFRDQGISESELTYQYYNCFQVQGEFQVSNPEAFIFDGTGATKGSIYPGLMGPEVDHALGSDKYAGSRVILNRSIIKCGKHFWSQKSSSTIVMGVIPGAGGTISIGTMNWVTKGLTTTVPESTVRFTTKVTTNILLAASSGPLGKQKLKTG